MRSSDHGYCFPAPLHGPGVRVSSEGELVVGEVLQQQCGQVPILSEMQQVLHVQGLRSANTPISLLLRAEPGANQTHVNSVFAESDDNVIGNEDRLVLDSAQAVEGETSWKTGYTAKERLEGLGQMMRDEVLGSGQ